MVRFVVFLVLAALAWAGVLYFIDHAGPGLTVAQLILDAGPLQKLLILLLNLTTLVAIGFGVMGLFDRTGAARGVLLALAFGAPALGALGALYGAMVIWTAIQRVGGEVSSQVWAPGAAESLTPLALGLSGATVAALFATFARKRSAEAPATA